MKTTDKKHANPEKLRGIFFNIGLIISLSLTFLAFEWTTPVYLSDLPRPEIEEVEEFEIPVITYRSNPIKPEVKAIEKKINSSTFNIVKNDAAAPKTGDIVEIEPVDIEFDPERWKNPEVLIEPEVPTAAPEVWPEFVGGTAQLFEYLNKSLKYPELAKSGNIQGKVFVRFVVNKSGKIVDVKILQGINSLLDKEALRVVESMPDWIPGRQHGKPVSVIYNLPISFKLK